MLDSKLLVQWFDIWNQIRMILKELLIQKFWTILRQFFWFLCDTRYTSMPLPNSDNRLISFLIQRACKCVTSTCKQHRSRFAKACVSGTHKTSLVSTSSMLISSTCSISKLIRKTSTKIDFQFPLHFSFIYLVIITIISFQISSTAQTKWHCHDEHYSA